MRPNVNSRFNFLRTLQTVFHNGGFHLHPHQQWMWILFPTASPSFVARFISDSHSGQAVNVHFLNGLRTLKTLLAIDHLHFFRRKCLFSSFTHLLIGSFYFLGISFLQFFVNSTYQALVYSVVGKAVLPCRTLFALPLFSFAVFIWSHLLIYKGSSCAVSVLLRMFLPITMFWRVSIKPSARSFCASGFTWGSLIHFEFIFVHGEI